MVGTVSAALVMAPILTLLFKAYGFAGHASARENPLIAVQANLMASVSKGVFEGALPWRFIWVGAVVAVAVIILDEYLRRRDSSFRTPVLAVAIGFYLPFELSVPIFAGGIIHQIIKVYHQRKQTAKDKVEGPGFAKDRETGTEISNRRGVLFASGLITGEALVGILLAIPIVISGRENVLAVLDRPLGAWPGVVLLVGIGYWLYRTGVGKPESAG